MPEFFVRKNMTNEEAELCALDLVEQLGLFPVQQKRFRSGRDAVLQAESVIDFSEANGMTDEQLRGWAEAKASEMGLFPSDQLGQRKTILVDLAAMAEMNFQEALHYAKSLIVAGGRPGLQPPVEALECGQRKTGKESSDTVSNPFAATEGSPSGIPEQSQQIQDLQKELSKVKAQLLSEERAHGALRIQYRNLETKLFEAVAARKRLEAVVQSLENGK